ncbi:MAG TPA: NAD(P)(+) transhydrogenase (Re/Si-specific) subunit beta [Gaiellaceae bacterium]|nr:NAD(P)(+) transhydrogenase (Re/Si-specific) subunit beta [Gaiellaceae bacterium]
MIAALSQTTVNLAYLVAAVLFILGIKFLSSPRTARLGNILSAIGMVVAVVFTLTLDYVDRYAFVLAGIAVGAAIGAVGARRVRMTAMPQMVALLNGAGGGAAAAVAIAEFDRLVRVGGLPGDTMVAIIASTILGGLTLSGSVLAFAKLQELVTGRPFVFAGQQLVNGAALVGSIALAVAAAATENTALLGLSFVVAAIFGVLFVLPIGGADMPVVIALLNAFSGLGGVGAGFVLDNNALIVGGALVGASGTLLTLMMAKAMNRSVANVLFGAFGQVQTGTGLARVDDGRTVRATTPEDVAVQLSFSRKVVVVPGYGMAVAQAQHDVRQLADLLEEQGIDVKYAIHPVAGRMPGHMNVLLAEANVPYTQLLEMDQINPEFPQTDVALVIGANDVTNPAARSDPGSPIYGMPILDVDKAASIIVMKRSMNPGFAGIDNDLYLDPKTTMLFGDAKESVLKLISAVKSS